MRIYITGTTSGLGKTLEELLKFHYPEAVVRGLNRPLYDLDLNIPKIIEDSADCDIFISNATSSFNQTKLLYSFFERNKDRKCHIISVGSVSADGDRKEINSYAVEKASLDKATSQLQLVESECKVSIIKPGRMETRMTDHRAEYYRMPTEYVAEAIKWMIDAPEHINVKTLSYDVHNSNRKMNK